MRDNKVFFPIEAAKVNAYLIPRSSLKFRLLKRFFGIHGKENVALGAAFYQGLTFAVNVRPVDGFMGAAPSFQMP